MAMKRRDVGCFNRWDELQSWRLLGMRVGTVSWSSRSSVNNSRSVGGQTGSSERVARGEGPQKSEFSWSWEVKKFG